MKHYKLIKEYPNSPKLNTIIEWRSSLGGYWAYKISDHKSVPNWQSIQITEPKNHPEYWQEVIEKDYEILSFKNANNKNSNWYKLENNEYRHTSGELCDLDTLLSSKSWNIHSVKRLSDSKIFTVGDIINFNIHNASKPNRPIDKIYPINNTLIFYSNPSGWSNELKKIDTYVKKLLFTTKDGVDIYPDMDYWMYNEILNTYHFAKAKLTTIPPEDHYVAFFNKEKAIEFRHFRLVRYSKEDVFNIIHKGFDRKSSSALGKHKVLAMFDIGPLPSEKQKLFTIEDINSILDKHFQEWNSSTMIDRQVLLGLLKQK